MGLAELDLLDDADGYAHGCSLRETRRKPTWIDAGKGTSALDSPHAYVVSCMFGTSREDHDFPESLAPRGEFRDRIRKPTRPHESPYDHIDEPNERVDNLGGSLDDLSGHMDHPRATRKVMKLLPRAPSDPPDYKANPNGASMSTPNRRTDSPIVNTTASSAIDPRTWFDQSPEPRHPVSLFHGASRSVLGVALFFVISFIYQSSAKAQAWTQWSGNGHYYKALPGGTGWTWQEANDYASARAAYLCSLTSAGENSFVFGLINSAAYWRTFGTNSGGPWIGGFQPVGSPEPSGNWRWISGETFQYSNWSSGEPNNGGVPGGSEDRVLFWAVGIGTRSAFWNDAAGVRSGLVMETNCIAFDPPLESGRVCSHARATFALSVVGTGPFTYVWQRESTSSPETWHALSDGPLIIDGIVWGTISDATTATLRAQPDPQTYSVASTLRFRCIVSNACGSVTSNPATLTVCSTDFNCDGFLDIFDYDAFVTAFETGGTGADFNHDGFADIFDYDNFVTAFENGC